MKNHSLPTLNLELCTRLKRLHGALAFRSTYIFSDVSGLRFSDRDDYDRNIFFRVESRGKFFIEKCKAKGKCLILLESSWENSLLKSKQRFTKLGTYIYLYLRIHKYLSYLRCAAKFNAVFYICRFLFDLWLCTGSALMQPYISFSFRTAYFKV